MVKSLSGGGLYAISVASKLVADYVNGDVKALEALEALKWELVLQYRLTKYVYRLVRLLEVTGLRGRSVDVWLRYLDYDHHLKLLVQLLGNARSYLALVRGRVELELKYSTGDLRWCSR
jgi:hypothetical protein